jgi:4-diphosphocytidyl-2-C-methyl-D-erythritol kinase
VRFRQFGPSLVVHTPAKLNLFLEILGKRDDGYHELETLMVVVDVFDTLTFTEENSREIRLRCSHAGRRFGPPVASAEDEVPVGADNLVVKAAHLLREHEASRREFASIW